jgi:hypothetical protein
MEIWAGIRYKYRLMVNKRLKFKKTKEVARMTVATRREREQHMRRETILDAGRKLFKDKGFEATTVDEIAALAELGKGTIYSYFKSKD